MRSRPRFFVALVVISAAALTACSGPPERRIDAPAPVSGSVVAAELPASQIPWGRVGPGWTLATWGPTPGQAGQPPPAVPMTLYLLDPAGARYPITTLPVVAPTRPGPGLTAGLVDWSGDGRHALLEYSDFDAAQTILTDVDLRNGATQTFKVPGEGRDAYSRPTGQAILASRFDSDAHASTLQRVDLRGLKELIFPTDFGAAGKFNGTFLQTPDGTQLVLGADNALMVVGNDGRIARQLPSAGPLTDCSPIRWWAATVILARCGHRQEPGTTPDESNQLWKIPLDGGGPTALTAVNTDQLDSGFGGDLGALDAWQLPSGTFLQSAGGCSSGFLSRLTPDQHSTPVTVPGVDTKDHSVFVIGTSGDKLVLMATIACGPGVSLLTYDPSANTPTVLLGPPVNGGDVGAAHTYPDP